MKASDNLTDIFSSCFVGERPSCVHCKICCPVLGKIFVEGCHFSSVRNRPSKHRRAKAQSASPPFQDASRQWASLRSAHPTRCDCYPVLMNSHSESSSGNPQVDESSPLDGQVVCPPTKSSRAISAEWYEPKLSSS